MAVLISFVVTGCGAPGAVLDGELPEDGPPPVPSVAAAQRLAEKAAAAGEHAASTGLFYLTVTDEEVTSILNISGTLLGALDRLPVDELGEIQDIPELEGLNVEQWRGVLERREGFPRTDAGGLRIRPTIVEPSVRFGAGQMILRGRAAFAFVDLPIRIVAAPAASDGELALDFVEGRVGAVPMPEFLFDVLGQGVARTILMGQEYVQITEISIGPGTLTIRGQYNG